MLVLKRFLERYPGSSLPTAIETTDGTQCVLKMKGAGNGVQSLLAELVVNRTAHALGWPVPDAFLVQIPDGFPWEFGTDEFDDIVQKSYGVNLGLEHLGPCESLEAATVRALPLGLLSRMAALDAFFCNYDRLPDSCNVLRDRDRREWIIDHGSCRFLDPTVSRRPLALPPGHLLAPDGLALVKRQDLLDLGHRALHDGEDAPHAWLHQLGWSSAFLRERIEDRLRATDEATGIGL